ncbi:MAG: lytic murein transglycosylase [Paracoccaceae bacterium]
MLPAQTSYRPEARPGPGAPEVTRADSLSLRPQLRPVGLDGAPSPVRTGTEQATGFAEWRAQFRARALRRGIRPEVFDEAFRGVRYQAEIIERDRNQSEFTKTIWEYLDSAVSETRIRNGRAALERHRTTLERIEERYGVEKEIVTAIWGLESAYGTFRGDTDVIASLATLAHDGRRGAFFEAQLLDALSILQSGDITARRMTGSWAGAMGHTQFMPSSYLAHAQDFTGDGRRDIWSDDPADALASAAAYLAHFGWTKGQPWGVEVRLPEGFDYTQADRKITKLPSAWARQGVVDMQGRPVPDHAPASVLLPAGARGAAFLIFPNFAVIERYNSADAYVIGVGHLADRIAGKDPIRGDWPRGDRALTFDERIEMQRRLTARGFDTSGIDGKVGPLTIAAVRAFQRSQGIVPDGYASLAILNRLR